MMAVKPDVFDFIVVGAGPAGCSVASALAKSKARPSVLLLEGGGDNNDPILRHLTGFRGQIGNSEYNWGYVTEPIPALDGRRINMERGRGLGGSSAINESLWLRGARDDWEEAARVTGNDAWKWQNVEERYRLLENYHLDYGTNDEIRSRFRLESSTYGDKGPIHLSSWEAQWNADMFGFADAWQACGHPINPDPSRGDPIGISLSPLSSYDGRRSTAADMLDDAPANLHILTESVVHRVLFENKTATGVLLTDGSVIKASKEIIISAGAIDTPKILLHSGIGPVETLSKFEIPIVHANEHVGRGLKDHYYVTWFFVRPDREPCEGIGTLFMKNDKVLASPEFQSLPHAVQEHIKRPTIAAWEARQQGTALMDWADAKGIMTRWAIFPQQIRSEGEVTIQSADPKVSAKIRGSYMEHEWDKRVTIEATREALRVVDQLMKRGLISQSPNNHFPRGDSDEEILAFWTKNLRTGGHQCCSCRTGRSQDEEQAVVDPAFKVFGVQGLRIADMSVAPFLFK
ncbi:putative Choline dehydrogenase [Seiridium unicorne]|uniref:Choline dehydrogenase n=1 Tax=Seiridium unicorne TaxID=138068 RepID=A0ABR2UTV1_9PEZI